MSDKLSQTLANLNLELPKTTNKVDLSTVVDDNVLNTTLNPVIDTNNQKILQKSKIVSNLSYTSGYNNQVKNIFEVANQEKVVTKSMKMYESITLELEEYCFGIKKMTGKPCFQQDVIANALIEYFKNHQLDEIFD